MNRNSSSPSRQGTGAPSRSVLCAAFAIFLTSISATTAHETQSEWPTPEQLAKVTPPVDNGILLARRLGSHLKHLLNSQQLELLDEMNHHLQVMQRVDADLLGADRHTTSLEKRQLVDYFRWRAEQTLLRLLGSLETPAVVELDFRGGQPDLSPDTPISGDRQGNHVLLRVIATEADPRNRQDDVRLAMQTWNLAGERPLSHYAVGIAATGTTYVLLDLQRVPHDQATCHVTFVDLDGDANLYTHALTFRSAPRGHLALDVVDEAGESIPVLLRIASHERGELWEPAEAVDLQTVLNDVVPHLSSSGRGYMFYLPGRKRGRYWIVKPPLEMPLPAGKWDVTILRGLEYSPIEETVEIKPDQWTRTKLQPRRWTDMNRLGWYSGDDHVHAQLLNSEDARKLLAYTRAVDINVANILEMGDVMRTYYQQRGFGHSFRVHHDDHWLIPGQEDPRSVLGHAIGLNLTSKVRDLDRYLSNDWIASEIHDQGGLYGHTHVGPNACFVHREMALFTPHEIVDFNSIMQASLGTELYYDFLNLGFKMTATAGADTPYGGTIGAVRTYARVDDPAEFSPDDWFEAIRRGNTFVTNGPMLELRIGSAGPGDEIATDGTQVFRVEAKAWGDAGWCAPARLSLIQFGSTVAQVEADEDSTTLTLSKDLRSEWGCWVAAHAVGRDGSEAHTTPIYLSRKGFRHWDPAQADRLIEKQLAVLREIESEVHLAERRVGSNDRSIDYWNRRTAEQADNVRRKVQETREIYLRLRDSLNEENKARNRTR